MLDRGHRGGRTNVRPPERARRKVCHRHGDRWRHHARRSSHMRRHHALRPVRSARRRAEMRRFHRHGHRHPPAAPSLTITARLHDRLLGRLDGSPDCRKSRHRHPDLMPREALHNQPAFRTTRQDLSKTNRLESLTRLTTSETAARTIVLCRPATCSGPQRPARLHPDS
jgi:hypothetical protein